MKKKMVWLVGVCVIGVALAASVWRCVEVKNRESDPYLQIAERIFQAGSALKEGDESFVCTSVSKVTPFTYTDGKGNNIVYYCCQTVCLSDTSGKYAGLDMDAIGLVIDLERIENKRKCAVGVYEAFQCEIEDRAYLCWTLSPEISCVIEYSPDTITESDIFRMAASVAVPKK